MMKAKSSNHLMNNKQIFSKKIIFKNIKKLIKMNSFQINYRK